jgi:hypothetical protein
MLHSLSHLLLTAIALECGYAAASIRERIYVRDGAYLTAAQVHRLAFAGKHPSLPYRRLLKLSRENGQRAFLRQSFFRTYDGNRVAVWAPTPHAMPAALARAPQLPELPKHDVGAQFLEHLVQLNELFVALWRNGPRCPRAAHPSFRWIPSDRVRLAWGEWEMREGRRQQRVIQPDAVFELPTQRRRYFLECEMGTQMISPGEASAPGATLSKANRYQTFLADIAGMDGRRTHYQTQYPDAFSAEVLFVVLTAGRARSVNAALASWRAKLESQRPSAMRAITFDEAAAEFRKLAGLPAFAADKLGTEPEQATRRPLSALSAEDVALLRHCTYDAVRSIKRARAVFRELRRHDLPEYPESYEAANAILERLARSG